ncbi:MAG: RluA family pseudouridine synthase [Firmicutes bacterium]|nr:RluA family pseudouridine synthase [Bacillota bacterium]
MIFEAEEENIGKRLDSFLSENMEDMSRSYVQKLIESGNILINEKNVAKNYKLRKGDIIKAEIPEAEEIEIKAENIPLDILYEDDDVIVINKEQGMVVHPAAGHYSGTLVNALMYHCKDSLSGINGKLRPGIVHRIDMDTSGVIVAAKNDAAHQCLAEQLEKHSIKRIYNAVVERNVKDDEGTIDKPIGRHPTDRKKMAVTDKNSKRAVTHYKVTERLGKFTVVEFRLETGRTHQIRVHFASIGHPLVGDTVYGSKKNTFGLRGQALHARILGFIHPRTNEYMEFESPLPDYFIKLVEKLIKLR